MFHMPQLISHQSVMLLPHSVNLKCHNYKEPMCPLGAFTAANTQAKIYLFDFSRKTSKRWKGLNEILLFDITLMRKIENNLKNKLRGVFNWQ